MYLAFSDWFRTKRTSVWFQINRCMVITIWFGLDLIRFGKDFSACVYEHSPPKISTISKFYRKTAASQHHGDPNWRPPWNPSHTVRESHTHHKKTRKSRELREVLEFEWILKIEQNSVPWSGRIGMHAPCGLCRKVR